MDVMAKYKQTIFQASVGERELRNVHEINSFRGFRFSSKNGKLEN